jgi:hypothetical protein
MRAIPDIRELGPPFRPVLPECGKVLPQTSLCPSRRAPMAFDPKPRISISHSLAMTYSVLRPGNHRRSYPALAEQLP